MAVLVKEGFLSQASCDDTVVRSKVQIGAARYLACSLSVFVTTATVMSSSKLMNV